MKAKVDALFQRGIFSIFNTLPHSLVGAQSYESVPFFSVHRVVIGYSLIAESESSIFDQSVDASVAAECGTQRLAIADALTIV